MSRNDPLSRPLTLKSRGTAGQMRSSEGENLHVGCTHLSLVRTAAVEVSAARTSGSNSRAKRDVDH